MADGSDWCGKLNNSALFDLLRKNASKLQGILQAKSLLAIHDGKLYVWDAYSAAMLVTNLRSLKSQSSANRSQCQTLSCTNAPSFAVDCIDCNYTGTHVFVAGRHGVSVILLPQTCGQLRKLDDCSEHILARTVAIAERDFVVSDFVLLHAAWHPGSKTSTHLVLLTSDNVIRIYDISVSGDKAVSTIALCASSVDAETKLLSPSRHLIALGDTAVSFDFGEPVDLRQDVPTSRSRYLWPIYVLLGNGEVYRLLTSVDMHTVPAEQEMAGPLRMYPAAEDNYGMEACSILCLDTRPQILVVATCEGKLHHCLILSQPPDSEDSAEDISLKDYRLREVAPTPALYICETVELELSLATVSIETDESLTDYFSCPLRLTRDPVCTERYHCSHAAGLHSLALPWIQKFQHFCESGEPSVSVPFTGNQQAIEEHLVCTKPLRSSPLSPVLGVCVVADRLLGNKIICLTSTLECIVLPLLSTYRLDPLALTSDTNLVPSQSPLRQMYKEPFDVHIRKILQRNCSNPILRSSSSADPSAQECLQLLVRATQVFREEYIQKFEQAREEIARRIRVLQMLKQQQQRELSELDRSKSVVATQSEQLIAKYHKTSERQKTIVSRTEAVLRQLQQRAPVMSDAEKEALTQLKDIKVLLNSYTSKINTIEGKMEYQSKTMESQSLCGPGPVGQMLSSRQIQNVRSLLKNETEEITDLVKQIKDMQTVLTL